MGHTSQIAERDQYQFTPLYLYLHIMKLLLKNEKLLSRLLLFVATFLLTSINMTAQNQFFLVNDKDGLVNVRESADVNAKIIGQLKNRVVVAGYSAEYMDSTKKNWIIAEFYLSKEEAQNIKCKPVSLEEEPIACTMAGYLLFEGYIYKDRVKPIEDLKPLKSKSIEDQFLLYDDSIKIKFSSGKFQKEKHKISRKENFVTKIDGHYFAGTDGDLPRYEIKGLSIEINHQKVDIPKSVYYDLYEPNLNDFTNAYTDGSGTLYIIMHNSDAAGSYDVIFIIKGNKFVARYVFGGGC
jgi:hypothetical protein